MPTRKAWEIALKILITVGLFVWLLNYANVKFVELFSSISLASPGYIFLALVFFMLHTGLVYLAWHKSLAIFNIHSAVQLTAPLFAFSTLTKYVPGGIWHAGSRVYVLGKHGFSRAGALFSVVMESVISIVLSAALLCLLYAFMDVGFLADWIVVIPKYLAAIGGILMLGSILSSKIFEFVFNWYYARKAGAVDRINDEMVRFVELVALHFAGLLLFVFGYYFSFMAYLPGQEVDALQFTFIILLATFTGFIAIFSPAGLGVRESVLYLMFATIIDSPILVVICLAPRFLLLVTEVLLFVLSRLFLRLLPKTVVE